MTTVLFVVRASITLEQEDAFNRWYDASFGEVSEPARSAYVLVWP